MTAAYRLKGVGWLIAAVAIALGFYLVSLRVAEERKRLEVVNARIATAERDIRALETEFDTRANLVQLERWNGDTLALAAPTAGQFVRDAGQLAAIDVNAARTAPIQTAALVVPSVSQAAPLAAAATQPPPAPIAPAPVRVASAPLDPAARATVVKAVAVHVTPAAQSRAPASRVLASIIGAERTGRAMASRSLTGVRPQRVAMLDDKLLSDATLGDLIARAKRESRHEGSRSR